MDCEGEGESPFDSRRGILLPPQGSSGPWQSGSGAREVVSRAKPDVLEGSEPSIFERLPESPAQLAIWRREFPRELESFFEAGARRAREPFERELMISSLAALRSDESFLAFLTAFEEGEAREELVQDLLLLMERTAHVAGAKKLRVFFGRVDTDRCRKFHVDYLRLRVMTTYFGPGTEWIHPHDVNRAALENPAVCPLEANRKILRPGGQVQKVRAGDVLLLKGALFDARSPGAVHRSPPVEHAGLVRLVFIATPLDC